MNCNHTRQIHRYRDGELAPQERAQVDSHLKECPECRQLMRELSVLSALLARAMAPEPEPGFIAGLPARCLAARDRNVVRFAGWLTGAAAAVLLGALLTWPASRSDSAASPDSWEVLAMAPSVDVQEEISSDPLLLAQWMADELKGESR